MLRFSSGKFNPDKNSFKFFSLSNWYNRNGIFETFYIMLNKTALIYSTILNYFTAYSIISTVILRKERIRPHSYCRNILSYDHANTIQKLLKNGIKLTLKRDY